MPTDIDVSDIITEYGALYKNNGQSKSNLISLLYRQTDTTKYMTTVFTDDDTWDGAEVIDSPALQPFHINFTPSDGETFKACRITLAHFKVDRLLTPDKIEKNWLGFLADNNVSRKEWPITRYILEERVGNRLIRDYEKDAVYKGVYVAPNGTTPGTPAQSMNGIGKLIADGITAGDLSPIATGALSSTPETFCEQVEAFANSIASVNSDYGDLPMNIFMSKLLVARYKKGFRRLYGTHADFDGVKTMVQDTQFGVVGVDSMNGRSRLFATVKENFIDLRPTKRKDLKMDIQAVDRQVKALGDFKRGVGFATFGAVFVNDQA